MISRIKFSGWEFRVRFQVRASLVYFPGKSSQVPGARVFRLRNPG
jgi:hypothetical protein